ncbi:MAG: spore germination protein [Clostridia bacterium]
MDDKITANLELNLKYLKNKFTLNEQFFVKRILVLNTPCAVLVMDGMVNKIQVTKSITDPLIHSKNVYFPLLTYIKENGALSVDICEATTFDVLINFLLSGFAIVLADNENKALAIGVQGFPMRQVSETASRTAVRGSREGFCEVMDLNLPLIRRRLKTPNLKAEISVVGRTSKTRYAICYLSDMVSPALVLEIREKMKKIDLDVVLETGNIQPFLEKSPLSLFSDIGYTERPDDFAGKLSEGRIGILLDGTPYALIIPFLFSENFQGIDDYSQKFYYASFIRILKYIAFFVATMLPGIFVAIGTSDFSAVPFGFLIQIAKSEQTTPLPLMLEAIFVYIFYEIIREAGMNLPKSMGHAVSIVGAIVIGQASVTAGIVGGPMIVILSLTVICSFLLPDIFIPTTILRFGYILVGGIFGLYGVFILFFISNISMCAINSFGIPYTAPISPFSLKAMRDTFIRTNWTYLGKRTAKIQNLVGSEKSENKDK